MEIAGRGEHELGIGRRGGGEGCDRLPAVTRYPSIFGAQQHYDVRCISITRNYYVSGFEMRYQGSDVVWVRLLWPQ